MMRNLDLYFVLYEKHQNVEDQYLMKAPSLFLYLPYLADCVPNESVKFVKQCTFYYTISHFASNLYLQNCQAGKFGYNFHGVKFMLHSKSHVQNEHICKQFKKKLPQTTDHHDNSNFALLQSLVQYGHCTLSLVSNFFQIAANKS